MRFLVDAGFLGQTRLAYSHAWQYVSYGGKGYGAMRFALAIAANGFKVA